MCEFHRSILATQAQIFICYDAVIMDETHQQTIELIEGELDKKGMSQRQLALKAGIKPPNLSRVMKGKSVPTVSYLGRLATALGKKLQISFIDP